MKKIIMLLLVVSLVAALTACGDVASSDASTPQSEISSTTDAEAAENKKVLAQELLADFAIAKNDSQYVYSDRDGTTSLNFVDAFIADVKRNDWASFTGVMVGGTVPLMYEAAYQPNGEILLTCYFASGKEKFNTVTSTITDIYETETFYQFSNNKDLHFSIPRVSLADNVLMDDYVKDSDLPDMPITAAQAKAEAKNIYSLIYGYHGYANENNLESFINGYGIIIPENLSLQLEDTGRFTAVADGAAKILGKPYYQISFYSNGEFAGESYYIGAENIFMVSMVDGSLIPVCYKNAEHFTAQKIS